jgi:hypothetical protein
VRTAKACPYYTSEKLSYGALQGVLKFDRVYALAWRHCGPILVSEEIGDYKMRRAEAAEPAGFEAFEHRLPACQL